MRYSTSLRNSFPIILTILFAWIGSKVTAQLNADFTVSVTQGCAPLQVDFVNTSTGNPTSFTWYVGNNATPFVLENPSTTYTDGGVFTVTLIVSDGVDTDTLTKTDMITVFGKPDVNFTAPNVGCIPFTTTFKDITVLNGATIVEYDWTFGIGSSTLAEPTVTYTAVGEYSVSLSVKDNNGCVNSKPVNKYIRVTQQPISLFDAPLTSACDPPLAVSFTAAETGNFTYTWDIEGQGSRTGNPLNGVNFNTNGRFDVTLTVSGPGGCLSTLKKTDYVVVDNPTASFTLPVRLCADQAATFTNTSVGAATYSWDFGNAPGSTAINPSHTYPAKGTYRVSLLVVSADGLCRDSTFTMVDVQKPIADFIPKKFYSCEPPETVSFTSLSTDAVGYSWNFSNGTSTLKNPTQTFGAGDYTISLVAISANGCNSPAAQGSVNIHKIVPAFDFDAINGGCVPKTVNFRDLSVSDSAIVAWDWNFGNGKTSALKNPPCLYDTAGEFNVTLSVTNKLGCKETITGKVELGKTPTINFIRSRFSHCAGDTIMFFDKSNVGGDSTKIDYWKWTFQSNSSLKVYNGVKYPLFENAQDTGYFSTELIVGYNGCLDTLTRANDTYRFGAVVKSNRSVVSCLGKKVTFDSEVKDYTYFSWDYGDGSADTAYFNSTKKITYAPDSSYQDSLDFDTIDHNFATSVHHYDTSGTYNVRVLAYKDTLYHTAFGLDTMVNCPYWDSITVVVPELDAVIKMVDTICHSSSTRINAIDYGDADVFEWFVNGVKVASAEQYDVPTNLFTDFGRHEIKLVVHVGACSDTAVKTLTVLKPKPVITSVSPATGCAPLRVIYRAADTSGIAITQWLWNFGTGAVPSSALVQNPDTIYYNNQGTFQAYLTAQDKYGCQATTSLATPITVTNPVANFDFVKTVVCQGDSIRLINKSGPVGLVNWRWFFSNGGSSTDKDPVLASDNFDTIRVTLIADIGGECFDTIVKQVIVEPKPTADFIVLGPAESNCYPFVGVQFVSTTTPSNYSDYLYRWDLGEGSFSDNDTAGTGYFSPGKFSIKLLVTTPSGACVDSILKTDFIVVKGPSADFNVSDTNVCVKDEILYSITNKLNVDSLYWDFGDGSIVGGVEDTISHSYAVTGTRKAIVVIISGDCLIPLIKPIYVNDVVARFELPDFPGFMVGVDTLKDCGSFDLKAKFLNLSAGTIDHFQWQLNNGQPVNEVDTTITGLYSPGSYRMFLAVSDNGSSCADTAYQDILVFPNAIANAGPDVILCPGDSITLNGEGGIQYQWSPGVGISRTDTSTIVANPLITTAYELIVTDTNTCQDRDSITVFRDRTVIDFTIPAHTACGSMVLAPVFQSFASTFEWTLDNTIKTAITAPVYTFLVPGKHVLELTGYDLDPKCRQTKIDSVEIYPIPVINMPIDEVICLTDSVLINCTTSGIDPVTMSWSPTTGLSNPSIASPMASPTDSTLYVLTVTDKNCSQKDTIIIDVDQATASFDLDTNQSCYNLPVGITNTSFGKLFKWEFTSDPLDITTAKDPVFTYMYAGTYTIRLTVIDKDVRCRKVATKEVTIFPAPPVKATGSGIICNYDSLLFKATGAPMLEWTPAIDLATPLSGQTWCYADTSRRYIVTGTDLNGCQAKDSVDIGVQEDFTYPIPVGDTIVIGEIVNYNVTGNPGNIIYSWTPADSIECPNCPDVSLQPLTTTCYRVRLTDERNCYPKFSDFCIVVRKEFTVDVPKAFTPNGDGTNDKLFVRGFGIRKLLNFTIYNRWGEVVFETTDINVGWDGHYKDKIQNDETYAFIVNAEAYNGEILTKNGYISILK